MALIPLPPGFTLPQFLELQGQLGMKSLFPNVFFLGSPRHLVTIAITVAVAFAIVVWD